MVAGTVYNIKISILKIFQIFISFFSLSLQRYVNIKLLKSIKRRKMAGAADETLFHPSDHRNDLQLRSKVENSAILHVSGQ